MTDPEPGAQGPDATFDFSAASFDALFGARPDLAFYLDEARESGGPVLELGCGTGRVLLPVARAGIEITGLDASPGMLAVVRRKLAAEPPAVQQRVQVVAGDMRDFALGQTYRLALIPFRTFEQLTTRADERACLAAIRRHLGPGGRLALDLTDASPAGLLLTAIRQGLRRAGHDGATGPNHEPEVRLPDGRTLSRTWRRTGINFIRQVQQIEMCYVVTGPDGRQEQGMHRFCARWLYRRQAERLLAGCWFQVEHCYADYDKSECGSKRSGDLIIVARRL